jgi:hypothetical protein
MSYISFIDDTKFKSLVSETLKYGHDAKSKASSKFNRNVIDPFSILWEMSAFDSNFDTWYNMEISRQAQKTLSNQIGMFHQKFLGSMNGWEDLMVGKMIDLVNNEKKILAEIKNKHNTVTGARLVDVYKGLENLVMPNGQIYKGYTAYYVEIVPKKPVRTDIMFTPSDNKTSTKCSPNEKIRKIDGASFYALVTGVEDALEQVFNALPKVIKDLYPQFDDLSSASAYRYYQKAYLSPLNKFNP